jgi:MoxR-like ATPase
LYRASKATAYLKGRDFVSPMDISYIAKDVLRHRIILSYEAQANDVTTDSIIESILGAIDIP